jgi:hypothetical protein
MLQHNVELDGSRPLESLLRYIPSCLVRRRVVVRPTLVDTGDRIDNCTNINAIEPPCVPACKVKVVYTRVYTSQHNCTCGFSA